MQNEPWIDKIFKDQLSTREVPLDMSHWAQAEAMIVLQEKEKNKRRVIFWLLFLGLGIIAGFLGWNQSIINHQREKFIPFPKPPVQDLIPPTRELTILPDASELKTFTKNTAKTINKESLILANKNQPFNKREINPYHTNQHVNHDSKVVKNQNKWTLDGNEKELNKEVLSKSLPVAIMESELKALNESTSIQSTRKKIDVTDLATSYQLTSNPTALPLPNTDYEKSPILLKKGGWKEHGMRMTLAQASGLNLSDPSIRHAGLEYYTQKSLNQHLFYGYSLGYKSNFNHTQYAQVLTSYQFTGFGSNVKNFGIKPEWMSALYIQGYGGMEVQNHRLMVSLRPEFIIGVKGKVDQLLFKETTGIKDIALAQISPVNKGWLQSGTVNNLAWTLSFGYEYRIMKKLAIGLQIDHALKSPYRPLDGEIKQVTYAAWNTGFRFSYILN